MRIRGLVLMAALCAGCLGGSAGDTPSAGGDPHLGVTATFPAAWAVSWRPCRDCVDPRGIFDAASYRTAERGRGLMCDTVPDGNVVISLSEVRPELLGDPAPPRSVYAPRPESFRIGRLRRSQVFEGCDEQRTRLFRFRDSGRLLYAWAVFGPHPSRAVRGRVEAVLNSLRIAPLR
jgi:hypothetical protein